LHCAAFAAEPSAAAILAVSAFGGPVVRIDRDCGDFFRRVVGDLLDVHAAFRGDERNAAGFTIDQR
jgi:hypothetical protein